MSNSIHEIKTNFHITEHFIPLLKLAMGICIWSVILLAHLPIQGQSPVQVSNIYKNLTLSLTIFYLQLSKIGMFY